jgi:hypothetical protein
MATRGTPQRVVRVDDETWAAFGRACKDKQTTRADELRRFMRQQIKDFEAEQRQLAAEQQAADA